MIGVEFDMVVSDSLKALELYERIFEIERVEVTDFPKGENEVIFNLYGTRFHMLDENPDFFLKAPSLEAPISFWFNILVPDIKEAYSKAMDAGCNEIQTVTEMPDYGISNAVFKDPFGYQWMLHQMYEAVSFEDRTKMWEEQRKNNP